MTQTDLELEPRTKLPERDSQCYELLRAFQRGERLTTMEAFSKYGITTISQRVGELKRKYGWTIFSETVEIRAGTRVSRYWMEI